MAHMLTDDLIKAYFPAITASPLFQGLGDPELKGYLKAAHITVKDYKKNDFIALAGEPMEGLALLLEGAAHLTKENAMGQRVIMAELKQSSMFGEALLFTKQPTWPATIKTTKSCKVMFIPLATFMTTLPDCHDCQRKILTNLLSDLSEKALILTKKVHYLTLKGMREKIFAYLTDIYQVQGKKELILPHNRQEMADALNVCRTALSRELSRLRDEEIIEISGKHVTLKNVKAILDYGL